MEGQLIKLEDFVGRDLAGFSIEEYTEIYMVNVDGRKINTIGFFKDEDIAIAFAQNQTDANYHRYEKAFILTDGKIGFLLDKPVQIIDGEKTTLEIREKALKKLSAQERIILGI